MTSINVNTFDDIVSLVENRGNINGDVQTRNREFIQGAVNEWYVNICSEREWPWTKFDRSFIFGLAITIGTASVQNGSREVTLTGLSVEKSFKGRSISIDGTETLYRIIAVNVGDNKLFLESPYIHTTDALATYKIYEYEFPLPPDLDSIKQISIDYTTYSDAMPDLLAIENSDFNRMLYSSGRKSGVPTHYTKDSLIGAASLPALGEMVLKYDFLVSENSSLQKLRIFPIEPDKNRVIHLSYTKQIKPMVSGDTPIIPKGHRWMLVHFALSEWHLKNGNLGMSDREMQKGLKLLSEMRSKQSATDSLPRLKVSLSQFLNRH